MSSICVDFNCMVFVLVYMPVMNFMNQKQEIQKECMDEKVCNNVVSKLSRDPVTNPCEMKGNQPNRPVTNP